MESPPVPGLFRPNAQLPDDRTEQLAIGLERRRQIVRRAVVRFLPARAAAGLGGLAALVARFVAGFLAVFGFLVVFFVVFFMRIPRKSRG